MKALSQIPPIERRRFLRIAGAAGLLLLAGAPSCSKPGGGSSAPGGNVDYYTCTMHPSVHLHDPNAKCPICGMDLVPVMKRGSGAAAAADTSAMREMHDKDAGAPANEFVVPVERQQQIGVRYATVAREPLRREIRAVGLVMADKSLHWEFVARVEGYVQTLYVTSPGELVVKDQPLLTLYSPDLLTAENELVELLRMRDNARSAETRATARQMIDSSKRRLEQWNVTGAQIAALEKSRQSNEFLTLLSPFNGIVEDVPVEQGRNVKTGDHLVNVADLSKVWVWADFYENELPKLRKSQKVTITTSSYPGENFEGEISLIDPFLDEAKRTGRVRIDIPNPYFKLRPAMYVNVGVEMDEGDGLSIPVDAIMPAGSRNIVFVDKGGGKLEPRLVNLGAKFCGHYEVLDGLAEGERIVSSANFLIDAEAQVQGALKSFDESAPISGREAPQ